MRTTTLEKVLFPVELRPAFFQLRNGTHRRVENRRVVVNLTNETAVGLVGRSYHIVTNAQAVDYARQCACQLFGTEKAESLEVFNVQAPADGWCCHVDLIHKGFEVNVFRQEVYLPFVRMTNSYNGTRALRFDVGYCRKLCLNGVLFEAEAIHFNYTHSRGAFASGVDFEIGKSKLETLRKKFTDDAEKLHDFVVPHGAELPLFFKGLELTLPTPNDRSVSREELVDALTREANGRMNTYFGELGRNGYALFNAMTDFASRPPSLKHFRKSGHSMQMAAGRWAREFSSELSSSSNLNLNEYLGDYLRLRSHARARDTGHYTASA